MVKGTVLVDDREPLELREWVGKMFPEEVVVEDERMEAGDFAFLYDDPALPSIGIARKEVSDFISSLFGGNLETDLAKMIPVYDKNILLLEGVMAGEGWGGVTAMISPLLPSLDQQVSKLASKDGRVWYPTRPLLPTRRLANLFLSIQMNGVDLVWSPHVTATAGILVGMWGYLADPSHRFLRRYVRERREKGMDPKVESLLGLWPGLRQPAAEELLKAYGGDLGEILFVISQGGWKALKARGIGPKAIANLKKLVGEKEEKGA